MAKKKAAKARTSRKPERKSFQGFGETLLYGLVLVGLPIFFAWLLQLTASAGQRWLFSLLMVSLGVAWGLRKNGNPGTPLPGSLSVRTVPPRLSVDGPAHCLEHPLSRHRIK